MSDSNIDTATQDASLRPVSFVGKETALSKAMFTTWIAFAADLL